MREIKFRGKRVDTREWIIGSLDLSGDSPCITWQKIDIDGYPAPWFAKVEETTIDEFTGLTDSNGIRIYEGDIIHLIQYNDCGIAVVKWNERVGSFCIQFRDEVQPGIKSLGSWINDGEWVIVIGNIYDSPNLLKRK